MSAELVPDGPDTGHRLPCTPEQVSEARCYNGGECYSHPGGRVLGCNCLDGWTGKNCHERSLPPLPVDGASGWKWEYIAIVAVGLAAMALLVFFIVRHKIRQRRREMI